MKEEAREATEAEQERQKGRTAIENETAGMNRAYAALEPLEWKSRRRALRWLGEALENEEPPF